MSALLRAVSPGVLALMGTAPTNTAPVRQADLFAFTLNDGVTTVNLTSFDTDLVVGGVTYLSAKPWLTRGPWAVGNTMTVETLTLTIRAGNDAWRGGASIKQQIVQGLFDGATFLFSRLYMTGIPGALVQQGVVAIFGGEPGAAEIGATTVTLTIKGKVNKLDQNAPRNLAQVGCNHAFCDPGCTLSRTDFTASFTVGANPTATFIPWASAPSSPVPAAYQNGTFTLTNGAGAGETRTIAGADGTGLSLAYPLPIVPAAGDAFTAFQGCDKTSNASGSVQSCAHHVNNALATIDNRQHFRGFEYVPPPNAAV